MSAIAVAIAQEMVLLAEISRLRCHWATVPAGPDGETERVFVPGCWPRLYEDPDGPCDCTTLARRVELHIDQSRELQQDIGLYKKDLRAWRRAAAAAWSLLTGRPGGGGIHPQDLAAAVHTATAKNGSAR